MITSPIENLAASALAPSWYVAHCKPHKESAVVAVLQERLGLKAYLPMVRHPFRARGQPTPLFPGYIFIWAELNTRAMNAIPTVPGILCLLAFGGLPQAVPPGVIDGIRERVDRLNAQGGLPAHPFSQGEPVYLSAGPLQGLEAVFLRPMQSGQRVKVLIEFLGQLREAELPLSALRKVGSPLGTKRPRRTRGRGRLIKTYAAQVKLG